MKKFYVYALIDSSTALPFYIGKGCGDRMYRHVQKVKRGATTDNPHLDRKIKKLLRENIEICHAKLVELDSEDEAFKIEDLTIRGIGLENLCNTWGGGKGGRVPSDEVRAKISQNRKGIPVSEETRQKLSLAKLDSIQTEEWKIQQSLLKKGKPQSEKQKRANIQRSLSMKGRTLSEEHKIKLSEAKCANPVRHWEGKRLSNETKEKIRNSVKNTLERKRNESVTE